LTRDQALAEAHHRLKAVVPEHVDEILSAIEGPEKPSPEFSACLEAAKAGAKFKVEMHDYSQGRRGRRGRRIELTFDSRDPVPERGRMPDAVAEASRITFETGKPR